MLILIEEIFPTNGPPKQSGLLIQQEEDVIHVLLHNGRMMSYKTDYQLTEDHKEEDRQWRGGQGLEPNGLFQNPIRWRIIMD